MKTCDEMVNSLFERRKQYAVEQKRKRRLLKRAATSMCCVCLAAVIGLGLWYDKSFSAKNSSQTAADALYPGIKDVFDERNGESVDNPAANNKIIVNRTDKAFDDRHKFNIELAADDFIFMSKDELNEYYGLNIFPIVPDDVKEWEEQRFGIYKKDGGTGEVYWDKMIINYSNEDFSRTVNVEAGKNSLPLRDYGVIETAEEKSVINNIEVVILQHDNNYFAQFMYQNVVFRIITGGLSQEEFISVVSSLIK